MLKTNSQIFIYNCKFLTIVLFFIGLVSSGCASREYRTEQTFCEAKYLEKIPSQYIQRTVTAYKKEMVPTGKVTCSSEGNQTICEKQMKESRVPYEKLEMFDLNERLRIAKIEACTKKACLAKFGNNNCDTDT